MRVVVALALVMSLAGCRSTQSLHEDAIQTCGKGNVKYVDINSQQFGCKP